MATAADILAELEALGDDRYKRMMMTNHGVREPCYGVKIGDLQPIRKRIKQDYQLALDLWDTGNYDARYLAGLIADDARMTRADLQHWVESAAGGALSGTSVATVAAGSHHGREVALAWIDSPEPRIAAAGWATWSCLVALKPDAELDAGELHGLLARVKTGIHGEPDGVRYAMNAFVISLGCYVTSLTGASIDAAEKIGTVTAKLGNNSCAVPSAVDTIRKVQARGSIGKKRKTVKC
ncbi:DNA alkylation repair protein [Luteolibacter marinus]|uniref:DNA alkylation repair protein n=1 Tax=Luteolibacter marinus TaxID=2776705 RepID=UPI0018670941|nr:DNA alkylation repair protein [Luteolibacter marinus]